MNLVRVPLLAASLLALVPVHASAKSGVERWIATSTTAMGITGDILLSPTRLRMAGHDLPLRVASDLPGFEDLNGPVAARVLKVTRPAELQLLHGNRFGCGGPVRWIVVWRQNGGRELTMDTFTGATMPTSIHGKGFCGSYLYSRP